MAAHACRCRSTKQGTTDPFLTAFTCWCNATLFHGSYTLDARILHLAPQPDTHKDYNRNNGAKDTMNNDHQASTNYREAFQLFDKRGNGRVDRGALGDLLRACGQNPTLAEITDLERGVGADCTSLPLYSHDGRSQNL